MLLSSLLLGGCLALFGCATTAPVAPGGASLTRTVSLAAESNAPAPTPARQRSHERSREQTAFGIEEEIEHPVNVPEDVLQLLRRDERNRQSLAPGDIPASWFVASEIHLDNGQLPDLIVTAADPRLLGANLAPFWVFRNTSQGHELALSVSALSLKVLNTRTNGYRNIRASAATARRVLTAIYIFDGNEYRRVPTGTAARGQTRRASTALLTQGTIPPR